MSNGIPIVTLPGPYLRGRFTLSLYNQMRHYDLIAINNNHYISLSTKLLTNNSFQQIQSESILKAYNYNLHRNKAVAEE